MLLGAPSCEIHQAIVNKLPLDEIRKLVDEASLSHFQPDYNGDSPLHLAAESTTCGDVLVKLLAPHCRHVRNIPNKDGLAPLHVAVSKNNFSVIEPLLDAGCDIELKSTKVTSTHAQPATQLMVSCNRSE